MCYRGYLVELDAIFLILNKISRDTYLNKGMYIISSKTATKKCNDFQK